jgi:antitoxin component HigA of HigAB toxin-antitoxin module
MATLAIDPTVYGEALATVLPRVIKTQAEHERVLGEIEKLMSKPRLTREERELYELLMALTGDYESKTFPRKRATPTDLIQFLLEQNGQPQKVLAPIFGEAHVSEVLHGKRKISVPQAVKLGKHFNVDPTAFIQELVAAASD